MQTSRWGSRYAIAASTLALLFALGGTAYAVNTVRSSDIVNGTIKTDDLGTGSVRSIDIKNGAVTRTDIAAASLGRAPAMWGRIESIGETFTINRGGLVSVDQNSTGRYTIQAGRDITACTYQVTPRVSGVAAGTDQASTTAVNVYVDDINSGNPFQADFDIVFFC
jgi:hypothetical protein